MRQSVHKNICKIPYVNELESDSENRVMERRYIISNI